MEFKESQNRLRLKAALGQSGLSLTTAKLSKRILFVIQTACLGFFLFTGSIFAQYDIEEVVAWNKNEAEVLQNGIIQSIVIDQQQLIQDITLRIMYPTFGKRVAVDQYHKVDSSVSADQDGSKILTAQYVYRKKFPDEGVEYNLECVQKVQFLADGGIKVRCDFANKGMDVVADNHILIQMNNLMGGRDYAYTLMDGSMIRKTFENPLLPGTKIGYWKEKIATTLFMTKTGFLIKFIFGEDTSGLFTAGSNELMSGYVFNPVYHQYFSVQEPSAPSIIPKNAKFSLNFTISFAEVR